ncbi:UvrD-helicase domain-containing protein [Methanosphaera sp.]
MISSEKYIELVNTVLNRNLDDNLNQKDAILAPIGENQCIIAGPGSGKTTVLVLKILKYYFVDDISLNNIIVTTFTKKAARELKERTISWANKIATYLGMNLNNDFDKIIIGTLDSIAEDFVLEYDDVEVIDNFTASALMMQTLLTDERNTDKNLKKFLKKFKDIPSGINTSEMNNQIQSLRERMYYDMVDFDSLKENAGSSKILFDIIDEYNNQLKEKGLLDYSLLEDRFYNLLMTHRITKLENVKVLLIDEYQDTNYLQEQIYFKIAEYVKENKGSMSVVGDDDQSLYRFRGAVISLFTKYNERVFKQLGIKSRTIYLQKNYRSTRNIIDFTNDFIHLDKIYLNDRSANKPLISPSENAIDGLPVMGLFRKNIEELSTDLSNLIYSLISGHSSYVERNGKKYEISINKSNPSIAVLTNSPKEVSVYNKKRLPFYIRESLSYKDENILVFNPRGQNIESTDIVSLICGLILVSIDSDSKIQDSLDNLPPRTKKILKMWREYIEIYVSCNDKEIITITGNVDMDELMDDIEGECKDLLDKSSENLIYHDIIIDTIAQTSNAISFDGTLSSKQIFWHILVPIASGAINIDDDMFDINIDENVNIMSIHQSKGLEFDIVIVDVGSDILNNASSSAFKRFPKSGGKTYSIEKYIRPYSKLSEDYSNLKGVDGAFNDLIRRYFVAYTRAKSILILVGLNNMRYGYRSDFQDNVKIPNVATGWSRDNKWHWDSLDNLLNI